MSERFLREKIFNNEKFNLELYFYDIVQYQSLSDNLLIEFQNKIELNNCYEYIFKYRKCSEFYITYILSTTEFYEEFWDILLENQTLSETFLNRFKDNFTTYHFKLIGEFQKLSETFIHEWRDKLDWNFLLVYQDMSINFISKHWEYTSKSKFFWSIIKFDEIEEEIFLEIFEKINEDSWKLLMELRDSQ